MNYALFGTGSGNHATLVYDFKFIKGMFSYMRGSGSYLETCVVSQKEL